MDVATTHKDGSNSRVIHKGSVYRELDNYVEYVWRPVGHERRVSTEEWWRKREYLWPQVATVARRRLATQASSECSEVVFRRQV